MHKHINLIINILINVMLLTSNASQLTKITDIQNALENHQKRMALAIGNDQNFQKFVEKYSPPVDVIKEWVQNEYFIYQDSQSSIKKYQPNKFLVKDCSISRIINAERLRKYIQEKKYTWIDVPKKYIFLAGNKWLVMADEIKTKGDDCYTMPFEQFKELFDIVVTTGYRDFYNRNVEIELNDEKIYFIDTEDQAFAPSEFDGNKLLEYIDHLEEYSIDMNTALSQEGVEWFELQKKGLIEKYTREPFTCTSIRSRKDLDDPTISTADVRKYISAFQDKNQHIDFYQKRDCQT